MNSNNYFDGNSKAGITGGLLCTLAVTVPHTEIVKTILLTTIGAIVSFLVSLLLKNIVNYYKKGGKE